MLLYTHATLSPPSFLTQRQEEEKKGQKDSPSPSPPLTELTLFLMRMQLMCAYANIGEPVGLATMLYNHGRLIMAQVVTGYSCPRYRGRGALQSRYGRKMA
jgi:hypothetical protein